MGGCCVSNMHYTCRQQTAKCRTVNSTSALPIDVPTATAKVYHSIIFRNLCFFFKNLCPRSSCTMAAARKKAEYQLKQRLNKCRNAPDILRVAASGDITAEVAAHTMHMLAQQNVQGPPTRGKHDWVCKMHTGQPPNLNMLEDIGRVRNPPVGLSFDGWCHPNSLHCTW